jgi:LPXTG-motif cell wall-anchored protein
MNHLFSMPQLLATAPLTGDEGMTPILIVAVIGVVLVGAFLALTAIQKKRNANKEDDGE